MLESVENIFSLLFPIIFEQKYIQFCGSSFAEFFVSGCLIMMSLFWSSLLLCSLLRQSANLSSIHDAIVYSKNYVLCI